jgi:beta-glucosidase
MTGRSAVPEGVDHEALLARLSLEEKMSVLTGGSAWGTVALPSIGLRSMVLSDGPSGVRGALWDERDPSLCLPSGTALSSSWDVGLARAYGAVVAAEARRKGVDVVLGPTVNLHRSPLGGRHFEAFSEDPILTADLAAAYVQGVQASGVGAAIKHYVANDFETDRFNADVRVSDRALRELYLLAFERAVREAGAWLVMSAYNAINGTTASENTLLTDPLTTTWGFDGVVVSDWTAVRSIESARHPQHLAMPGPDGPWGEHLARAVRSGEVDERLVDEKVRRILRLAARVGALDGIDPAPLESSEDGIAFARRASAAGSVLVKNEGLLPVDRTGLRRVAVIGDNAKHARVQGGGSATVVPERVVSPVEGIRLAFGSEVSIEYEPGAVARDGFSELVSSSMANPVTGGLGARVSYFDADGAELFSEDRLASFIMEFRDEIRTRASMTFETTYTPDVTEVVRLGFASPGTGRLFVDGELVLEATVAEPLDQVQGFFSPPSAAVPVRFIAGSPVALRYEFVPDGIIDGVPGSVAVTFGTEPPELTHADGDDLIARAVDIARTADLVVVVVGTNARVESEGYDRSDLRLPGRQDELVSAVAAVNPRTVVVVNAGAPVELPWNDEVGAVLVTWFGGQEFGNALADVLIGEAEPGGRLPTTWPKRLVDAPVTDVTPVDRVLSYDEGIHIGYRAWLRADARPAYAFGHGLGYTEWAMSDVEVERDPASGGVVVTVTAANIGARRGKQVVQLYARRTVSAVERPALWLVGFASVDVGAGDSERVRIAVPHRAFAHWDDGWSQETGEFDLLVGASSAELLEPVTVRIDAGGEGC